jgi:hypothetical protein
VAPEGTNGARAPSRSMHGRRRSTPGPLRTRVITDGVTPSLHPDYKHTKLRTRVLT